MINGNLERMNMLENSGSNLLQSLNNSCRQQMLSEIKEEEVRETQSAAKETPGPGEVQEEDQRPVLVSEIENHKALASILNSTKTGEEEGVEEVDEEEESDEKAHVESKRRTFEYAEGELLRMEEERK